MAHTRRLPFAPAWQCPRKWRPETGPGTPFAFKMVSKSLTPITNLDKHRLNGEPRLAAGEAADDGGRHGESD
jgi:hypothetical protein